MLEPVDYFATRDGWGWGTDVDDCPMSPLQSSDIDSGGVLRPLRCLVSDARALVDGPRQEAYGPPVESFTRIGRMWAAILDCEDIAPEQVAIMLAAMKLARLAHTPGHEDSQTDTIGYIEALRLVL